MTKAQTAAGPDRETIVRGPGPPPPAPRALHAGPLTLELHGIEVAYVRLGEREVVRRIYAAVRDEAWDTLLPDVQDLEVDERPDGFTVRFTARHEGGAIAFGWDGAIEGLPDGTLVYSLDGRAERDFSYARIGFCILHAPEEYAGRPYRAELSGRSTTGRLPSEIAPQLFRGGVYVPALAPFTRLEAELDGELHVAFDLEGDEFELEDQRNWTDASFKTYSTPLQLGYPHRAHSGQAFRQRVRVAVGGGLHAAANRPRTPQRAVVIELGEPLGHGLPALGTTLSADTSGDASLLRHLGLAHLRVEIDAGDSDAEASLARAADAARSAGSGLQVALFANRESAARAGALVLGVRDVRLLGLSVFDRKAEVTPRDLVDAVGASLARAGIAVPVGGGTDLWFAEINREPPDFAALDYVTYSITPQVHAFDDVSLVETLAMQRLTVESARSLSGGLPVVVGPVTLRPRGAEPDPRQASLFCAAWTIGSLKQLALARPESVSYHEAFGPNGLVDRQPLPVHQALGEARALAGAELVRAESGDPTRAEAIVAATPAGLRALVVNLGLATQRVRVGPARGPATVRVLDAHAALSGALRAHQAEPDRGAVSLELEPYAVAAVELS